MYTYPEKEKASTRFKHLLRFCTRESSPQHEKNFMEIAGDCGLFHIERLPKNILRLVSTKAIAFFIWFILELFISYVFYPTITHDCVTWTLSFIPEIPWWFVRLSLYLVTIETIFAYFLRAEGRLFNESLMARYREV